MSVLDNLLLRTSVFVNEINAKADLYWQTQNRTLQEKTTFFHVGNVLSMCILLCQKCCIEL